MYGRAGRYPNPRPSSAPPWALDDNDSGTNHNYTPYRPSNRNYNDNSTSADHNNRTTLSPPWGVYTTDVDHRSGSAGRSGSCRSDVYNNDPNTTTTTNNSSNNNNNSNADRPTSSQPRGNNTAGGNARNGWTDHRQPDTHPNYREDGNRDYRRRGRGPSETRYGRRNNERPYDRDLPYWNRLHPHTAPSSTDSHRERERSRREEREREDRRRRRQAELDNSVPEEVPLRKNVLTVHDVIMHIPENTKEHRTNYYDCTERETDPRLVLRRGQVFILTLVFQRPWSSEKDDLYLQFSVGENPSKQDGSLVRFPVSESESSRYVQQGQWGGRVAKETNALLTVYVYIPANAIVGEWECRVTTALTGTSETFVYDGMSDIFVLFNPWCKEDRVFYTENKKDLDEYVLNEHNCVFCGQTDYISRKPWFCGQFQDGILDICMTILRMGFDMEVTPEMGDAVMVTRKLSRILNNTPADPGIMSGRWSGNYDGGTSPTCWRSSVQILREYARTRKAVNYAQCWVFSQLLTTVCRALGIPCRSLTNFESAHDTDKTATIDSYKDQYGEDIPEYKSDSVWNFHCWNDVWINRPDLDGSPRSSGCKGRYSGWHAVDSTPQERSQGRFQCGPTPHLAIKNGELSVGYDTVFLFAGVNAEICTWIVPSSRSRDFKLLSRVPDAIGKNISTKVPDGQPVRGMDKPGSSRMEQKRLDITYLYKYPEGSQQERDALKRAVGRGLGTKIFETPGGITLDIKHPPETLVGNNFVLSAVATNNSEESRKIRVFLGVYPIDYRGERLGWDRIASSKERLVIEPGQSEKFELQVSEAAYLGHCDKSMSMMLTASAIVEGHNLPISKMQKFVLKSPDLPVQMAPRPGKVRREEPFTVLVMVTNPCSKPLTGCYLQLSGTIQPLASHGFSEVDGVYTREMKDLYSKQVTSVHLQVQAQKRPLKHKLRELDIDLICDQLPPMTGNFDLYVQ